MSDEQLSRHIGRPVSRGRAGVSRIFNHRWDDPAACVKLGTITEPEVATLSGGRLAQEVDVTLNGLILDYDHLILCGPVFPHEVEGFSGGSKYLIPGIAGPEIIGFTHWLGALLSSFEIIGTRNTPVRAVIERAAQFIPRPITSFRFVVSHRGLAGMYAGQTSWAWEAAAELSARVHIVRVKRPFIRVLAVIPEMYAELWTAAKGMYKLEPAVADGGEVILYAPNITDISLAHGGILDQIGYHCRDYFLAQWDRFRHIPGRALAHSTHVKGRGRYDAATGVETPRIQVTLATGIPEARCRRVNLAYLDPATIRLSDWEGREESGLGLVPQAGEVLYRLSEPPESPPEAENTVPRHTPRLGSVRDGGEGRSRL